MKTDISRFQVDRIEIIDHPDHSFHVLAWGSAVDPTSKEDHFKTKVNFKEVPCRIRRMENASIDPQPGARPGYVLRMDFTAPMQSDKLQRIEIAYNDFAPIIFEPESLAPFYNMSGCDFSVDLCELRYKKLLIGGWFVTPSLEDLTFEVFDANDKKIENARITMTKRLDVRRFYFVLGETICGFNISIPQGEQVATPVYLKVSNSKDTWIIHTDPTKQLVPVPHDPIKPTTSYTYNLLKEKIARRTRYYATRLTGKRPTPPRLAANLPVDFMHQQLAKERAENNLDPIDEKEKQTNIVAEEVEADFNDRYNVWFRAHRTSADELAKQRQETFEYQPLISLIVAAFNTPLDLLEKTIGSVKEQTYPNWQLCIADGSTNDQVETWLKNNPDPRISWCRLNENKGIAGNMNAAVDLAKGEIIALYDHDDFLEPDCLYQVVKAFNEDDYQYVYTDEDKYEDSTGRYVGPNFKPDYSPALLQSTNYICHFLAMKREIYDLAGGTLRSEFDGAQDFDLMLRLDDVCDPNKIKHIPKILYHWRMHDGSTALDADSKTWAYDAGERALMDWTERNHTHGHLINTETPGHYHMRFDVPQQPLISIIIPNKDHADDLTYCIQSIENLSRYRNFEIIIVENNSELASTKTKYKQLQAQYSNVKVVVWDKPFNYSAINNYGVTFAKGEYLLFLNNDTEAFDHLLLEELLGQCVQKNVGAVGAKLYYEDGTFQHNGVIIGHSGVAGHALCGQSDVNTNYRVRTVHNVSCVTAACMMVPKKVFNEVQGFNEDLPVAYNDVDFCLRIRDHGYWIVQNPYAQMYHYESRTRGFEDSPEKKKRFEDDVRKMYQYWPDVLRTPDPFYNINLDITNGTYQLRQDDEFNPYINPLFLGDAYYTAGTIRPEKPTEQQLARLKQREG
ncbi:glycosyltransferase family 2 protein [Allobaculum stercoricanis]|uniref:glycosyltransferase family 2 protein n=1 Tax=Allobaculum stercoricanis TaxID=174709 RepID=UPI00248ED20F|nr:glycosyltransferase family 2 protein [Allobaculum stercoricanis]